MKVRFKDGTVKNCGTPTEQKFFKADGNSGWVLCFSLMDNMTSTEADEIITPENVSDLSFISEDENGKETTIHISGYERISSTMIRHSEEKDNTKIDIQVAKEV